MLPAPLPDCMAHVLVRVVMPCTQPSRAPVRAPACCRAGHRGETRPKGVSQTAAVQGTVLIHNAEELQSYSRGEEDRLEAIIKSIADSGARVGALRTC